MAVFHPTQTTCICGCRLDVNLARSVNVKRNPVVREQILSGKFQRTRCSKCNANLVIESPFYYSDPDRHAVFLVQPRKERFNHVDDGQKLTIQKRECVLLTKSDESKLQMRVVYGLDELREKLISQDAGFNDRYVELLKLIVVNEHPFLLRISRLQLVLANVTSSSVEFIAYHHNQHRTYSIQLPSFLVDGFFSQPDRLESWNNVISPQNSLLAPERRWVNFRRLSSRYDALGTLKKFAQEVKSDKKVDLNSDEFAELCVRLKKVGDIPEWGKQDLAVLFEYAKKNKDSVAEDRLFEARFGITLDDEWSKNGNSTDIDTIWSLLRSIPANNIEGNAKLKEIQLIAGGGGLYQDSGIIQIGKEELSAQESFKDVLRHEVGHAVHANKVEKIDLWLEERFGWRRFQKDKISIDKWVALMGGWQKWGAVTPLQQMEISNALVILLGNSQSWEPGAQPVFPASHPWFYKDFGPRIACEKSTANWYETFSTWYRVNGVAFYLNYWYAEFVVVDEKTLELISKMPSPYASMSHSEFFAELYSLYYDQNDPLRKVIPVDVLTWLENNFGLPVVN